MGQVEETMRITVPMVTELAKTADDPNEYLELANKFAIAAEDINEVRAGLASLPIRDPNDVVAVIKDTAPLLTALEPVLPGAGLIGVLLAGVAGIGHSPAFNCFRACPAGCRTDRRVTGWCSRNRPDVEAQDMNTGRGWPCPVCGGDRCWRNQQAILELCHKYSNGIEASHMNPGGRRFFFASGLEVQVDDQCNICDYNKIKEALENEHD
jgi:hypothetical protein